jgi:hypothetical protein
VGRQGRGRQSQSHRAAAHGRECHRLRRTDHRLHRPPGPA